MRNASKMARYMMMRPRGENGGDMRGEDYPRGKYNGGRTDNRPEQRGGGGYEPENRSRDSRGRYTTRNAYEPYNDGDETENRRGMRSEYDDDPEDRYIPKSRMNVIGFENRNYPLPVWEVGAHHGSHSENKTMRGHGESQSVKFTPEMAKEWTSHMRNGDGTTGAHWPMEQTKQLAQQRGVDADPAEFFAVLNAMYSDFYEVARKHNVHSTDFYVDLAKAWLKDEDAVPNKAAMYYECVVKH